MSDCQSSLCKMNGCMFPQACPNDRAPAPDAPAARDDALDAKRWREIRKHLKRDTWAEDDEPAHNCTVVYFAEESIAWPGMFLTIEQVVDALADAALPVEDRHE